MDTLHFYGRNRLSPILNAQCARAVTIAWAIGVLYITDYIGKIQCRTITVDVYAIPWISKWELKLRFDMALLSRT